MKDLTPYQKGKRDGWNWDSQNARAKPVCPYENGTLESGRWHRGFLDGIWEYIESGEEPEA